MTNQIILYEIAQIINGPLAGHKGMAVEYYSLEDEVEIQLDGETRVVTKSGNVVQE